MQDAIGRVEVACRGGLRLLTLSSPARRNALSVAMRTELLHALDEAIGDRSCRAIILTGEGGHFCAGGDLRDAVANSGGERRSENLELLQNVIRRIGDEKPVIAAVEGGAYGAGLGLAASCDFIFASETAQFAASFAKVGLSGDAGITWSLPRRLGALRGFQMLLSGETVSAEKALEIGLVDTLVDEGEALTAAIQFGEKLASMAPLSLRAIKAMMRQPATSLDEALQLELKHQIALTGSQDYVEGKMAFLERRPPNFNGN